MIPGLGLSTHQEIGLSLRMLSCFMHNETCRLRLLIGLSMGECFGATPMTALASFSILTTEYDGDMNRAYIWEISTLTVQCTPTTAALSG